MGGQCHYKMSRISLFSLVILNSVQTFERITFTEAAFAYRSISENDMEVWRGLLFAGFGMAALLSPWLGVRVGVKSVAKIGAFIALFVALSLYLIDKFSVNDEQFINLAQALAIFVGISDCMLAFAVLTAFINTTPEDSRGWNFGLLFAFLAVTFVLGIDHEGVLSSLGVIETTNESSFSEVCFFMMGITFFALILIWNTNFKILDPYGGGEEHWVSYRWWRTLIMPGVRWSCCVVISFALLFGYIRSGFFHVLEVKYRWDIASVMNVSLCASVGFLFACPVVGRLQETYGSLKVMTAGNFALAGSILFLALFMGWTRGEQITVGFITTCLGISSTPSVVAGLINMQENMEVGFEGISGSATSSLYISCWLLGMLFGFALEYRINNKSFKEIAYEGFGLETFLGLFAAVFSYLNLLNQPVMVDEFAKQLAADRAKKTPYVVETSWEAI